jgi:hypothetical protein
MKIYHLETSKKRLGAVFSIVVSSSAEKARRTLLEENRSKELGYPEKLLLGSKVVACFELFNGNEATRVVEIIPIPGEKYFKEGCL